MLSIPLEKSEYYGVFHIELSAAFSFNKKKLTNSDKGLYA
jgi:hypothetical protein